MATEFINEQWRIPNSWNVDESNQDKISNYSMKFNGTDTFVNVGLIKPFNNAVSNFAVSYWIKANFSDDQIHFDFRYNAANRGVAMENGGGTQLIFYTAGNSGTTWSTPVSGLNSNEWNHIVLNFDGSIAEAADKAEFWINGDKKTNTVVSPGNSSTIAISGDGFLGNGFNPYKLEGQLDQFCTFDYTLSSSQIAILYGNSAAGYFQIGNPMALTPNPVAFYPLGDQGLIGAGYNGANWLVPNQVAISLSSYVFNFDGTDDYIDLGDSDDFSFGNGVTDSPFSVSAWVNMTDATRFITIAKDATGGREYVITTLSDDKLYFYLLDNSSNGYIGRCSPAVTSNQGNWIHTVYTYNGNSSSSGIKIYLNGSPVDNDVYEGGSYEAMENANTALNIGRQERGLNYTNGLISNTAIFNTELTSTQVTTLYNNGEPGDISSLSPISWYKLNAADTFDAPDWTINDYGSGGNDGTSVNMTSANLVVSDLQQTSGYSPYAIELNGTDQNFVVDNSSKDLNVENVSLSAWFFQDNTAASSSFPAIIINGFKGTNGGSYWGLVMRPGNIVRAQLKLIDPNGNEAFVIQDITRTITTGQWNHVAMTYDGTTLKGYINGVEETLSLVTSAPGVTPIVTSSGPITYSVPGMNSQDLLIGKRGTDSFRLNGKLSNFAVWGSGLSTAQVATIYNNGIPGNISSLNPLAWWELGSMMGFNGVDTYTALSNTDSNYAAVSTANMEANDVVNGPGYSDGGLGISSLVIEKQAPYSFNNALSESMSISNRDDSQASDPYPLIMQLDLTGETSSYTFTTPILYTSGDISIDWGDGSAIQQTGTIGNAKLTHVYDTDAYPRPLIQWGKSTDAGKISRFLVQNGVSKATIANLKQWGKSFNGIQINFLNSLNMVITAQDIPDLSNLTTMVAMFQGCSSITTIPNIEKWDVSNKGVSTNAMFRFCTNFIATDLDNFADNIFTTQLAMFGNCSSLNSTSISKWRTRGSMAEAFEGMTSLDQDLSTKTVTRADTSTYIAWDISDCTSLAQLLDVDSGFTGTNPNISNWDTSNIIGIGFTRITLFAKINSDMSTKQISTPNPYNTAYTAWDVSGGTSFVSMFQGNVIFNQNLRTWQLNESTVSLSQIFTSTSVFSNDNYTDTLVGWAVYLYGVENPPENLSLGNTSRGAPLGVLSFQSSRTVNSDDNGSTTTNYSSLYPSLFPETWTQAGDARDFLQETLGWSSTAGPL